MKRVFNISLLIILYALLCGKSCQEEGNILEQQEEAVLDEREVIRQTFEVPYLSEEARYAREEVAVQKLADLADLLAVFMDPELDTAFRIQAGQMIRNAFLPGNAALSFDPFQMSPAGSSVAELLQHGPIDTASVVSIRFDSILVEEPLQRVTSGHYHGTLTCRQACDCYRPDDTLLTQKDVRVEVHVVRTPKVFGRDTLQVWSVWLGDMTDLRP